jgi:hypothetical protein
MWKLFFNLYKYLNLCQQKIFECGNKKSPHQKGYYLYILVSISIEITLFFRYFFIIIIILLLLFVLNYGQTLQIYFTFNG